MIQTNLELGALEGASSIIPPNSSLAEQVFSPQALPKLTPTPTIS